MTSEQIFDQFGDVELTFTSFYGKQFLFRYEGQAGGVRIVAFCGGSPAAIKTMQVSVGDTITLNSDLHEHASIHDAETGQKLWSSKEDSQ